ncbi:MAG TPA: Ig-like domain-containing protein [Gaiellaceae bacterium]|nr:Ig-like domain-containing protein [Gaiellaceae bacterium]
MYASAVVRVRFVLLALVALIAFAALAGARVDRAGAVSTDLFISEYIEGTSNNKAIEIFNGTGSAVDLMAGGYTLLYHFNGNPTAGLTIPLTGSVAAGDVYVVAQSAASPMILAQADQTNGAGWFNGDDAVVLRKGGASGPLLDVIGQVGFDPGTEWGSGLTSTADNTLRRKTGIESGDTSGSDAFDPSVEWDGFATDTFDGLGFHVSGGDAAPIVTSSSPANGATEVATGANVTINFSEPVAAAAGWYTISCGTSGAHTATQSGGPQNYTLDPDTDFALGETCTVTVDASKVTDTDVDDPPDNMAANHSFSFTTTLPVTEIGQVQGAAHISPLNGQPVKVEGIVTARRTVGGRGYWIQDPTPDGSVATSDAVFVFIPAAPARVVGDLIRVVGTVSEFRAANDPDNLTTTQITSSPANITLLSSGNALPAPTILGLGGRMPPTENIDDDNAGNVETGGVFDPVGDGIDFYESLEGVILQVNNAAVVNATRSFGEITLLPDGGSWATGLRTPRGGILLGGYTDPNPERIIVDDEILRDLAPAPRPTKAMPDMNVGDDLTSSVVGPLDYSFSNYKIQATTTPTFLSGGLLRESTTAPTHREIVFGTFNVENLAGTDPQAKYDHLASLIVNNLHAPDVLGIEEVQDNDGVTGEPASTIVDASVSWNRLLAAIQAAGGPAYDYRQIDPVDMQDGGAPGGNIRVGFLFRTDRGVRFVDRPGGSSTSDTTVAGGLNHPELSASPGRIGTQANDPGEAFFETRKSLAAEFDVRGQKVFAIVNHFSSKTDDQPLFGPAQPPTRFSEEFRHGQAQLVNDFVDAILEKDKNAKIVVLGDINDFEFSETTSILEGGVLTSLMHILPPEERYSYVFEGNSQTLDQILLSNRGLLQGSEHPEFDVVHLNSEFADAIQASDHEPSVVRMKFPGSADNPADEGNRNN